ncbi:MAG TPA: GNAT family protein [Ramlibacter sp.]|jgi:RimJ/RimL family protein N-acetyltransferase|uniref:GNAT family N-acetyltransferase n=1 Tax=Ramlibacter sp. TaxID=1917967 RepID=UPI002D550BA5|nr:GNAT family protein [Ramlibacter sp.]HZY20678.1 GNAT family protein [Ramlibacter sp.]
MTAVNSLAANRTPARVRLRPTMQSDIDFVLTLEHDPENLPFITPWERTQHEAAIRFPDFRHFIIEAGQDLASAGFLILIGCRSPHQALELKRMVVRHKGEGHGRAALRVAKKVAFDDLGAHRFWLDVRTHNHRARALYDTEGFAPEGLLRECVRGASGFDSLVVMSMLQAEFADRRALALELPA